MEQSNDVEISWVDSEPHEIFKRESFSKIAKGLKRLMKNSAKSKLYLPSALDKDIKLLANVTKNPTPVVVDVLGPPRQGCLKINEKLCKHFLIML